MQVRHARDAGCLDAWCVLELPAEKAVTELEYAQIIAERVNTVRWDFDGLTVFGGDTAYAILRTLGVTTLEPIGEILPGVPVSRIPGRGISLISKAGGFGDQDLICALRRALWSHTGSPWETPAASGLKFF